MKTTTGELVTQRIKSLTDKELSELMFMTTLGENPQKVSKLYNEIYKLYRSEIQTLYFHYSVVNFVNLEILFEYEKRQLHKNSYFSDVETQSRVEGLFQTTNRSINEQFLQEIC